MRRLKYPYKFTVIGLLALSEILFLFYPLSSNLQSSIDVTRQELYGLAVDKPMLLLIQVVQQHRGLSAATVGGLLRLAAKRAAKQLEVEQAVARVNQAMAQHGAGLAIATQWVRARSHWATLRDQGLQMSVDENRNAHTALIKELLAIVAKIGDTSYLILDPDADSYYLMDAATINLPGTLELLGQLRAHGAGVLATRSIDEAGRVGFAGEAAVLRAKREELEASLQKISASSPALAERVHEFSTQFRDATDAILQIVSDDIVRARFSTHPERYVDMATAAIDLGFEQAQELLLPRLERLLAQRVQRLSAAYWRGAALTLASMLVFGYLAAGAYLVVMSSVRTLQTGADRMAAGDLTTPIVLQAQDELRLVAASFNHMGEQLALRTDQLHQTGSTLTQVQASYERAHSLAVLAALVPAISHDLITPISNANLTAASLREMLGEFRRKLGECGLRKSELEAFLQTLQEGLAIIENAGRRSSELAGNLKQLSVDQASERRRKFELGQLLDEVLLTLKPTLAGKPWRVERRLEPGLMLDSYPGPLGQVLLNLIQNATVHAFAGRAQGLLEIEAKAGPDDSILICLRDDGCGMSPEVLAQIFKPFFTTRPDHGGSGVGLAYAKRLVQSTLGGELEVVSEPGMGSTFSIQLPRVAPGR